MVIVIKDIVASCDTTTQGMQVLDHLRKALLDQDDVTLDFTGVPNVTSSFVNSALLPLLGQYDLYTVQNRLKIVAANRQIGNMIRIRMSAESALKHNAA